MMLKGYQRRLIMMPTKSSPHFEAAYFILRKETELQPPRPDEMLFEATRILRETAATSKRRSLRLRHLLLALGIGFALGALTVGMVWLGLS